MADIFISYSSHDRDKALSLAEELRGFGTSVWIDQAIDGAMQWSSEIAQALDECKALVLLVSKSSLTSKNCVKEVTIAAESDKFILPIDLEDIKLPKEFKYHLAGIQRVAYSNREAIQRALQNLNLVGRTFLSDSKVSNFKTTRTDRNVSLPDPIRIAVLPFDDLSQKKDNAWFADGMMDELIGTLSQVERLRVASRSEVIYYKKHRPKAKKIADDLKVRYLVEGSVRKAGEKIRITVSLTDSAFSEQLWMKSYDGTFDDVFNFQETVSKQIAEALELKLTPKEKKAIADQPTENTEAYELYLKGLEFHRLLTRDGYEKALKLYEAALALDPKYVDAYIAVANVAATFYRECSRDLTLLERAEQNLKKAEGITGETARTLWIRGEIEWQKGNTGEAEKILLRSAELDPSHHQTFNMLGNLYYESRKMEQAIANFESALNLIETCQNYSNLITALSVTSDSKKLRKISKKSIPIMEKHIRLNPDDFAAKVGYAEALYWAGQKVDSLREADQLAASPDISGFIHFHLATLYERFGDQKLYIQSLKKSINTGFREIEAFKTEIHSDPNTQAQIDELISYLEKLIENEK